VGRAADSRNAPRFGGGGATLMFAATIALCYPLQLAKAAHGYTDDRIASSRR